MKSKVGIWSWLWGTASWLVHTLDTHLPNALHVCTVTVRMLETQRENNRAGGPGRASLVQEASQQASGHSKAVERWDQQGQRRVTGSSGTDVWLEGRMPRQPGWTSDGTHSRLSPAQDRSRMFSETPALNSGTATGTLTQFCWGLRQNHQMR